MDEIKNSKQQSFLKGAAILAAASLFAKTVSAVYKIPLFNILDDVGTGFFQATYSVYALVLTVATFGVPLALSRLISSAYAKGQTNLVKRYFSVSLPGFALIGIVAMLIMFFFADAIAAFIQNTAVAHGIRVLSPAVFFVCVIAVFRGYTQGFQDMIPTAMTQTIEVICKAVFGIAVAFWLTRLNYELSIVSAGALTGVTIGLGLCIPLLIWYKKRFDKKLPRMNDNSELPRRTRVFADVMKVSIPITIGASFMSIMAFFDTLIVMRRLQNALGYTELEASAQFGIFAKGLTIYNLPSALIVPIAVSVMPAIATAIAKKRGEDASQIMHSAIKLVSLIALPTAAGIMVLANPIMTSLYQDPRAVTATILIILGAAAFFVCLQLITTAILQANGHERIAMMTLPVGAAVKIVLTFILVGNPNFGIVGSAIGTLACFIVISCLNLTFILIKVKNRPKLSGVFFKPVLCTTIMATCAFFSYRLFIMLDYVVFSREYMIISELVAGAIPSGTRMAVTAYMVLAIILSIIVYGISIIITGAVSRDDMKLVPKGDKLSKILRIK